MLPRRVISTAVLQHILLQVSPCRTLWPTRSRFQTLLRFLCTRTFFFADWNFSVPAATEWWLKSYIGDAVDNDLFDGVAAPKRTPTRKHTHCTQPPPTTPPHPTRHLPTRPPLHSPPVSPIHHVHVGIYWDACGPQAPPVRQANYPCPGRGPPHPEPDCKYPRALEMSGAEQVMPLGRIG